jgi:phosphatidate phosphatase APP1
MRKWTEAKNSDNIELAGVSIVVDEKYNQIKSVTLSDGNTIIKIESNSIDLYIAKEVEVSAPAESELVGAATEP